MSPTFQEMLETSQADLMDVDTSYLDAYRRGGPDELKRLQDREAQLSLAELEPGQAGVSRAGGGTAGGNTAVTESASAGAVPATHNQDNDDVEIAPHTDDPVASSMLPHGDDGHETPVPLQFTDHQEAAQNSGAATKGGSSDGDPNETAALPQSGFKLSGVKSQPNIKSLPDSIIGVLREQLRAAAVRELGVSDVAARDFAYRLSQGTLVTAFLLAQLDLRLDVDPATSRAADLFRSRDPLLGSVVARMDALQKLEQQQQRLLSQLTTELGQVKQTSAVIEQTLAYVVADRTENFLRGSHHTQDAPLGDKNVIFIRDKAREETRKRQKVEADRDGRPVR